jgi:hypothetical protein
MDKREAILRILEKEPNVPFTPNEIAVALKKEKHEDSSS